MGSSISPPSASRQLAFHQAVIAARKLWLSDGLSAALLRVDPLILKQQLAVYVPPDVQQILAAAGIRDEHVFPTPIVLEHKPSLVGYYRLLLGVPQKSFYAGATGMGAFKTMEGRDLLTKRTRARLDDFCHAMSVGLADLVRQMSPRIAPRDVTELPLVTLGAQLQGSNNNTIGQQAIKEVFIAIRSLVLPYLIDEDERTLTVRNAAKRNVVIALASDPDVRIQEYFGTTLQNKVAIEIKGGTDRSNAHNRAGEAEKSHRKAKADGFRDFWTVIATKGLDLKTLMEESPTTNSWFDAAHVLGQTGDDWDHFRAQLAGQVGIPV
jgi:XcyI restriction endonuclease